MRPEDLASVAKSIAARASNKRNRDEPRPPGQVLSVQNRWFCGAVSHILNSQNMTEISGKTAKLMKQSGETGITTFIQQKSVQMLILFTYKKQWLGQSTFWHMLVPYHGESSDTDAPPNEDLQLWQKISSIRNVQGVKLVKTAIWQR